MASETRRERQRRILVADALAAARAQLEGGGVAAVSLRGIARELGMSAPSLYTYFPSLADVCTALIVQSYQELASSIADALDDAAGAPVAERLLVGPRAYRAWAIANPQQFNLVFFDQIPGYAAPPGGPTVDAQTDVLVALAGPYAEAVGVELDVLRSAGDDLDGFLCWWGAIHGLVALEVNHHLDWVDAEAVFERRLAADVRAILDG